MRTNPYHPATLRAMRARAQARADRLAGTLLGGCGLLLLACVPLAMRFNADDYASTLIMLLNKFATVAY